MSQTEQMPSLEEFLAAPVEFVANVMPETVIFAVGGTRRSAALVGISAQNDEYASSSRVRMISCIDQFFRLGTRHLFTSMLRPGQLDETGRYRERILSWLDWGLAGPEALEDYRRHGWRVRLCGAEGIPELRGAVDRLESATPPSWNHTLWLYVAPAPGTLWEQMIAAAQSAQIYSQTDLIRTMFGEDIPSAGIYIGFGKPIFTHDIIPLALLGEAQCYWTQRPGYEIDEDMVRRIVYDAVYRRRTWREDKSKRYDGIEATRDLWESRHVIGIGHRVGGFWYPASVQDKEL
ncbi:hypothetical protein EKD04_024550 [Chloroflexales bacterium ZM16-3]|nr:hypothetical protein [Chloroflexales bacterium ZM16-3]